MNKFSIWDILTGITLLGLVGLILWLVTAFLSPTPLIAAPVAPTITQVVIIIPTATHTLPARPTLKREETATSTPESEAPDGQTARTPRPTSTIPPTNTPYIAPTVTPLPTITPLPSATRADANCYVIAETPVDNTQFTPGQEFTKSWTVKNNSGKTWVASVSDIRFVDGAKLQTGSDVYDLPKDIPQGSSFEVQVRMRAPSSATTYVGNWQLVAEGTSLCRFYVKIVVK